MNRYRALRKCSRTVVRWCSRGRFALGYSCPHRRTTLVSIATLIARPVRRELEKFSQNIHASKGLTCARCHGGDSTSYDPEKAMSRKAGLKGKIDRKQIPALCFVSLRCRTDAEI